MNNKISVSAKYIKKWLIILSVVLMIGGVLSFGLITYFSNYASGVTDYEPVLMILMMPCMALIGTPIIMFIHNAIKKHLDLLSTNMNEVANGNTNVYIKTADNNAFTSIYEDFNKMVTEIKSVNKMKTDILDSFSHEIKTPVSSIVGFSNILLEEELDNSKRNKYLKIINSEANRLANLIDNILVLSRVDGQIIVLKKEYYNLGKQIQDCALSLENKWNEKNITMTADLKEVTFYANAAMFESVWINLLTNAIKFSVENGEINISMKEDEKNIIISIKDSGVGMSKEEEKRIFDRFYQANPSSGHGLGLAIVKRIVDLSSGTIEVLSEELKGTTFLITLPKEN